MVCRVPNTICDGKLYEYLFLPLDQRERVTVEERPACTFKFVALQILVPLCKVSPLSPRLQKPCNPFRFRKKARSSKSAMEASWPRAIELFLRIWRSTPPKPKRGYATESPRAFESTSTKTSCIAHLAHSVTQP